MKNFVITKKFDSLGRVVIPKNMREHYGFESNRIVQVIPQKDGVLIVSCKKQKANQ
ncbi:MAG: AbrB/MazE/SpoVT family DNA-binding domain-containing protein [Clostridia bacterium]|nr:AbrB/MazE/SpoVT family DNA-binding domain-containing protein [Clostridia bacterium]